MFEADRRAGESRDVQILAGAASGASFAVWSPLGLTLTGRCMLVVATKHNVTQMPFLISKSSRRLGGLFSCAILCRLNFPEIDAWPWSTDRRNLRGLEHFSAENYPFLP